MPNLASVQAALKDGGVSELVRRTRMWTAARIYPGTLPSPQPAKPRKAAKPKRPAPDPRSVDHAAALAFFERRRPTYERLADAVAPHLDPDGVLFDVGANIGYFTQVVAERTGFRGTVHLFEPVPNLARLCRQTLAGAPYTAVVHEFGLSDEDATIEIFTAADGNIGWNTIVADKAGDTMARSEIEVRRFASSGITDVPTFVKIDVEGAEHMVLGGLVDTLATWPVKPVIMCEIGWGVNHPQWAEELAAFGDLAAIGYRTTDLDGAPVDVTTLQKTTDVLFLPAG